MINSITMLGLIVSLEEFVYVYTPNKRITKNNYEPLDFFKNSYFLSCVEVAYLKIVKNICFDEEVYEDGVRGIRTRLRLSQLWEDG